MSRSRQPSLVMVAGPNGSGKSTLIFDNTDWRADPCQAVLENGEFQLIGKPTEQWVETVVDHYRGGMSERAAYREVARAERMLMQWTKAASTVLHDRSILEVGGTAPSVRSGAAAEIRYADGVASIRKERL